MSPTTVQGSGASLTASLSVKRPTATTFPATNCTGGARAKVLSSTPSVLPQFPLSTCGCDLPSGKLARTKLPASALAIVLVLLALLATGCSAARAGRFQAFAQAGQSYNSARNQFLDEALAVAIERDTMELRLQTDVIKDARERTRLLGQHDEGMRDRIAIHNELKRHAELRERYFVTLRNLSDSKGVAGASGAANALASQIGNLCGQTMQRQILGRPVSQLVGQLTGSVVGSFRNRALEEHLRAHGEVIQKELAIEDALLRLFADEMLNDLKALHASRRRQQLLAPLRGGQPLSPTWNESRKRLLIEEFDWNRLQAAQQASANLRTAFENLLVGKDNDAWLDTQQLEISAGRLSAAIASLRNSR